MRISICLNNERNHRESNYERILIKKESRRFFCRLCNAMDKKRCHVKIVFLDNEACLHWLAWAISISYLVLNDGYNMLNDPFNWPWRKRSAVRGKKGSVPIYLTDLGSSVHTCRSCQCHWCGDQRFVLRFTTVAFQYICMSTVQVFTQNRQPKYLYKKHGYKWNTFRWNEVPNTILILLWAL